MCGLNDEDDVIEKFVCRTADWFVREVDLLNRGEFYE